MLLGGLAIKFNCFFLQFIIREVDFFVEIILNILLFNVICFLGPIYFLILLFVQLSQFSFIVLFGGLTLESELGQFPEFVSIGQFDSIRLIIRVVPTSLFSFLLDLNLRLLMFNFGITVVILDLILENCVVAQSILF